MSSHHLAQHPSTLQPRLFSRDGVLCAALLIVCLLLAWPVANVGINDDWVYTLTTLDLARTGHFIFHGWASPMLGWQALWGALFAHLFGAGFTAVRMSTIPVAAATVLLYHAILRRFALNAAHARLGTLVLVLSPVFLPLSATFMTDIPSVFAVLLCIYMCQLALAAPSSARAIAWLVAAGLTNIALGTVRQIAWLGVLVIVPGCAWLLRRRRFVPQIAVALWLIAALCIHLLLGWFNRQPFVAAEKLIPAPLSTAILEHAITQFLRAGATVLLLLLPVLALALPFLRVRSMAFVRCLCALATLAVAAVLLHGRPGIQILRFPWLGNTFGLYGILQGDPLFGPWHIIPGALLLVAVAVVLFCSWAAIEFFIAPRRSEDPSRADTAPPSMREPAVLLLPFLVAYCLLLLPRAGFFVLFDRYLLEVLVALLPFVLLWHQQRVTARIPAVAWVGVAVFAVLATAGTHDLFSMTRAELRAIGEVEQAGVPRTQIRGGFAFDFATQALAWGYLDDPRITNPPGAYRPYAAPQPFFRGGLNCVDGVQQYLPALDIRYVMSVGPSPCFAPSGFPPQTYRTWLPPARHQVIVGLPLPGPPATKR